MEASIPVQSRPVADSQEQQIGDIIIGEDGRDHTSKKHVGDLLRKLGADIIALTESESTPSWFLFVNETGHSRLKGAARQLVRSQVRRNMSIRKQNQKQTSRPKKLARQLRPNITSDGSREFSNSAVSRDQLVRTNVKTNLYRGQASNKFDPFNALPVGERGHSHYLISNFQYLWHPENRRYSPIRPVMEKAEPLGAAIFDSAFLHASLAHVSISLSNLTNTKFGPEVFYHISRAIAIVNKRLTNFRYKTITDNTICAITLLIHLELRFDELGSAASIETHFNGLEALVESKGGMITLLARDPFTAKHVYWVDINYAYKLGLQPRFGLDTSGFPYLDLEHSKPSNRIGVRYQSRMANLTGLQDISQETIRVYRILRHLITDKERTAGLQEMGITDVDFQTLQLYSYHLMYRLLALTQYKIPEESNQSALIYYLFGYAGFGHILMFTCNILVLSSPLPARGPILISTRMRAILERVNIPAFQIAYPEMMLWVIMIGGIASIGSENCAWFIELLTETCRVAGIAGTDELALFLAEFLWSEFYLGTVCNEFWVSVTKKISKGVS